MHTTVEWVALEFDRRDTPGYIQYVSRNHQFMRYRTLGERFRMELEHFRAVLDEPLLPIHRGDMDPETAYYASVAAELFKEKCTY